MPQPTLTSQANLSQSPEMSESMSPEISASQLTQLGDIFGFDGFRPGQAQVVAQLLAGHSSLAIFPTGSGKSLCYQFSALQLPHLTLVVSPLLALMKDQLAFLAQKGIHAASIDSSMSAEDVKHVMNDARIGRLKILMVSVERFKNERFRQFIESIPVSMLVVDEAHCISEWGHNFRPDYLKLPDYRRELGIAQVLLLTATATRKVKLDMASRFEIATEHIVQTGFYRPNLSLTVRNVGDVDKNGQLLDELAKLNGAGIIYVTLQQSAETLAAFLRQHGINASAYHAGFDDAKRQQIQSDFMADAIDIVVATIAFGMGIDKSNIRFVIHYDLPKSIENYSQEIGRAGRDGGSAQCITLAALDGINTVENFVYGDTPELSGIDYLIRHIQQEMQNGRWECQLHWLSNATNIRQLPLKTLLVQLEMLAVIKPQYAYFADVKFKLLKPIETILAGYSAQRQQFLGQIFASAQMKKVWGTVDFEVLFQRYGIERPRVIAALEYLAQHDAIELETKKITEVYSVDEALIHQTSLANSLHQYFVGKEHKEIARIAQLIRFFELERCLSQALSQYFDDKQTPQHCGHCSVCQGHPVKLSYWQAPKAIPQEQIVQDSLELMAHLHNKGKLSVSIETCCRFLMGISSPSLSRLQLKKLAGFGRCEQMRYADVLDILKSQWQACQP